jgi:flagellar assembly protein FliH
MESRAVLRHLAVEEVPALPARGRVAAPAGVDLLALALQEAREEGLRQGHERGRQAGYEEGLREGRAAARREADAYATGLEEEASALRAQRRAETQAALQAFQDATSRWLAVAEEDMVALCYEALGRILGERGTMRDQLRAQVARLLEQWHEEGVPALHVHPSDVELLEGLAARPFTCVADPAVGHGGCLLKGSNGALDARLESILEEIKTALLAGRNSGAPR